jgi:hypothetical protein
MNNEGIQLLQWDLELNVVFLEVKNSGGVVHHAIPMTNVAGMRLYKKYQPEQAPSEEQEAPKVAQVGRPRKTAP